MNALLFQQAIPSSSLMQNLTIDPAVRLRYLLHLQSMNRYNNINSLTMLPTQETPSPISENGLLVRQDSLSDDSRSSQLDERLSKLQELEQINKASLFNVLQHTRNANLQAAYSSTTIHPMFTNNAALTGKRTSEEYTKSFEDEVSVQKKVKTAVEGNDKHTSNIVITQPSQVSEIQKVKKQKEAGFTKARLEGCLKKGDIPVNVVSFKMDEKSKEFIYFVEWKSRRDGSQPNNSFVSKSDIMRCDPGLLVSFYENHMLKMMESYRC